MIGVKKIPKDQLQDGLVDLTQVTPVVLTIDGWFSSGDLYEYNYSNADILSTSVINIIPNNLSVETFKSANILPSTLNTPGNAKIYAKNLAKSSITVTINILN